MGDRVLFGWWAIGLLESSQCDRFLVRISDRFLVGMGDRSSQQGRSLSGWGRAIVDVKGRSQTIDKLRRGNRQSLLGWTLAFYIWQS